MKDTYTQAVLEHIKAGTDISVIAKGLSRVLVARGHAQLTAAIWQSVLRVLEAEKASGSTVYVVSAQAYETHKASIADMLAALGAPANVTITEDKTLIGGYIAEGNSQRVDVSYKRQLVDLYRKITT